MFKSLYGKKIIKYIKDKYNDELEYLWAKIPDCAIFRRKDNKKWYGLMLNVQRNKIGLNGSEKVDILVMQIQQEVIENTINNINYFPAYHMNKKNWFTICLDCSFLIKEIENYVDNSYDIAAERK